MHHDQRLRALEEKLKLNSLAMLARMFAEYGDPREDPAFEEELSPAWHRLTAWRYEVWLADPEGFVNGIAPGNFYPEPPTPGPGEQAAFEREREREPWR